MVTYEEDCHRIVIKVKTSITFNHLARAGTLHNVEDKFKLSTHGGGTVACAVLSECSPLLPLFTSVTSDSLILLFDLFIYWITSF